jgi:hypothetical protein
MIVKQRRNASWFLAFLAATCSVNYAAQGDTSRNYPPYPDVWGYEVPATVVTIWKAHDGDYLIKFAMKTERRPKLDGTCCREERYHVIQPFFRGKQLTLSVQEYDAFGAKNRDNIVRSNSWVRVTFGDGTSIKQNGTGGGNCYSPYHYWLEKRDDNGKVIARRSVFYLLDKPRTIGLLPSCGDGEGKIIEQAASPRLGIIDLADDTFLAYQAYGHVIARLDKNFNTQFPLLNKKVFLVDTDTIDRIKQEAKAKAGTDIPLYYQKVNDMVFDYLQILKKGR